MKILAIAIILATHRPSANAAVIAPVQHNAKPDEPIAVRFLMEKGDEGKKALAAVGGDATKIDSLFTSAPPVEVAGPDGSPAFSLFSANGQAIAPVLPVKPAADGSVDLAIVYPKLKEAGTYYLVWKDAAPLVIESLRNPVPWAFEKDNSQSADDHRAMLAESTSGPPVVTHLVQAEYAVITTDKGVMKAKFSYDYAPHTVENYISLARQGMYNNSSFHRIMKDFMIQGGDSLANSPDRAGSGGPGYSITADLSDKKHVKGTLSMARLGINVDTAGSQFFIMHGSKPFLDGAYSAFGDVYDGLDVVDTIASIKSEPDSGAVAPALRPKIISVQILPATAEIYGLKK